MTEPDAREGAEAAANRLRMALARHGIDLPELGLHFPAILAGYPIVSLGTITAETSARLADVLDRAHETDDDSRHRHAN